MECTTPARAHKVSATVSLPSWLGSGFWNWLWISPLVEIPWGHAEAQNFIHLQLDGLHHMDTRVAGLNHVRLWVHCNSLDDAWWQIFKKTVFKNLYQSVSRF